MAIYIKNPEVEASVRTLAEHLGVDLTQAVGSAVSHEIERLHSAKSARLSNMRSIANRVLELPVKDDRSADEILGYNGSGLPK